MNPIERLEQVMQQHSTDYSVDGYIRVSDKTMLAWRSELRAIIEALKQETLATSADIYALKLRIEQRDEAVRLVAEEMVEPQADAVLGCEIGGWVIRLRAALEGKHE